MPTIQGVKYPYTPKGRKAAARARNEAGTSTYDDVKTKSDMMAANISSTIKNMGGGYQGLTRGYQGASWGSLAPQVKVKVIGIRVYREV